MQLASAASANSHTNTHWNTKFKETSHYTTPLSLIIISEYKFITWSQPAADLLANVSGVYNRTNPHQAMFYTWSVCQGNKLSLSLTHVSAANSHTYTNTMLQIHEISLIITHMKPHSLSQSILDLVWQLAQSASPHADG